MVQRLLDQRVGEFRDHVGGEFRADGLEQEVALFVVQVFVKVREVRVVDVLGGGKQGGAIGRFQRPQQLAHGIFVLFLRHARRVRGRVGAGKENEGAMWSNVTGLRGSGGLGHGDSVWKTFPLHLVRRVTPHAALRRVSAVKDRLRLRG